MTAVRQDIYSAGAQATSILHDMIAGRKPVMTTKLHPLLYETVVVVPAAQF